MKEKRGGKKHAKAKQKIQRDEIWQYACIERFFLCFTEWTRSQQLDAASRKTYDFPHTRHLKLCFGFSGFAGGGGGGCSTAAAAPSEVSSCDACTMVGGSIICVCFVCDPKQESLS